MLDTSSLAILISLVFMNEDEDEEASTMSFPASAAPDVGFWTTVPGVPEASSMVVVSAGSGSGAGTAAGSGVRTLESDGVVASEAAGGGGVVS